MIENLRDLLYLWVWKLWVRVIVSFIIAYICRTLYQIQVQVDRDNNCTYKSFFLLPKKKKNQHDNCNTRLTSILHFIIALIHQLHGLTSIIWHSIMINHNVSDPSSISVILSYHSNYCYIIHSIGIVWLTH